MASNYLIRLGIRRRREAARRQIGFGLAAGWVLLLLGLFKRLYAPNSTPASAVGLQVAGGLLFAAGLFSPGLLRPLESSLRAAGNAIGRVIFQALLGVVYFCAVVPVGLAMQASRAGTRPESWTPKSIDEDAVSGAGRSRLRAMQLLAVFGHFVRLRRYILIPILVILLVAGLALFFVQSSVLAPLIYTLF